MVLAMTGVTWTKIYVSAETPTDLVASGEIEVTGDANEAARVTDLFDRYSPERAVVVPPAALFHNH